MNFEIAYHRNTTVKIPQVIKWKFQTKIKSIQLIFISQ